MSIVNLKTTSTKPKYKQIVSSIETAITSGILQKNDQLPSLNEIKKEHNVSRDTVLVAFNALKNRGIIKSIAGKGYYVSSSNVKVIKKIFLLFDELNPFKEILYNSFLANLDSTFQVDIFFHHFNLNLFQKLIEDATGTYTHYVIMPGNLKNTSQILQHLPEKMVTILDQYPDELKNYSGVYQSFEEDIFNGLNTGLEKIKNYEKLQFISTEVKQPKGIFKGFEKFCKTNHFQFDVVSSQAAIKAEKGLLYLVLEDKNLITLIKNANHKKLVIGKDIGIISFNDSPLKEIVAEGITTISTDFKLMGKTLANFMVNKQQKSLKNKSSLILRKSI